MLSLLNAPLGDVKFRPAKLSLEVLIADEDFSLGQHAKRLFDGLENCLISVHLPSARIWF